MPQETHVHRIVRQLGEEAITSKLSVSSFSVKAAKSAGRFPARWYGPMKLLCEESGIPCPLAAFNFLDPDKKPIGADENDGEPVQGDAA